MPTVAQPLGGPIKWFPSDKYVEATLFLPDILAELEVEVVF